MSIQRAVDFGDSLLSIPGVVSPEVLEAFSLAMEQAAGKSLDLQEELRREQVAQLQITPVAAQAGQKDQPVEASADSDTTEKEVEGLKMEKLTTNDTTTRLTSSGVEWLAGLVVLVLVGILALGARRKL